MHVTGFQNAEIVDITEPGSLSVFRKHTAELLEWWRADLLSFAGLQRNLRALWLLECILKSQLLIFAVKWA